MLNGARVIDADGHVNDWHIDWASYLPDELKPHVPRSVNDENGFPVIEVDGLRLPEGETLDLDYSDIESVMAQFTRDGRYWLPRPGEKEASLRLPDMEEMGIDVSILFGGHSFLVAGITDSPDVQRATLQAYNSYLATYGETDPERLKGVAMLAIQAPREAADELRRCVREYGFVAGVLPPHHRGGRMLDDPDLEPIWDAACELGVPICIHTVGVQVNPVRTLMPSFLMRKVYGSLPSMIALGSLIFGGVLERHPDLRCAFLEVGSGWLPYVMERLQGAHEIFSLKKDRLPRDPTDYIRSEQLYYAIEPEETVLPQVVDLVGEDRLVLGSDYCHPEGMCPYTMKSLAERSDLTDRVKHKILNENPARLYGL